VKRNAATKLYFADLVNFDDPMAFNPDVSLFFLFAYCLLMSKISFKANTTANCCGNDDDKCNGNNNVGDANNDVDGCKRYNDNN
jgi:hypothetical protein